MENKKKLTIEELNEICKLNTMQEDTITAYDEYGNKLPDDWKIQKEIIFPTIIGNKIMTSIPTSFFEENYSFYTRTKEIYNKRTYRKSF